MGRASRKNSSPAEPRIHWTDTHPDREMWSPGRLAIARTQTQEEYEALYGRGEATKEPDRDLLQKDRDRAAEEAIEILCKDGKGHMRVRWQKDFQEADLERFIPSSLHYYFATLSTSRFPDLQSPESKKELLEFLQNSVGSEEALRRMQEETMQSVLHRIDQFFKNTPNGVGPEALQAIREAEKMIQTVNQEFQNGEVSQETEEKLDDLSHEIAGRGPRSVPKEPTPDDHVYRAAHAALIVADNLCCKWQALSACGATTPSNLSKFEMHISLQEPEYKKLSGNFVEAIDSAEALDPYWKILAKSLRKKDQPTNTNS